jgi:hypothetical protein
MKRGILFCCAAVSLLALTTANAQTRSVAAIPHLEKRGEATQLIVDGTPYLALAGETDNTASSSLEYMDTAWPKIVKITFTPNTPGPDIAGLARVEAGKFVKGQWIPGRRVNGDDVVLEYYQAAAAGRNQSGSGSIFGAEDPPSST